MSHDKAFQLALQKSIEEQTDYVVFRSEMNNYGAMPLNLYEGYSSDTLAVFENGVRIDNCM